MNIKDKAKEACVKAVDLAGGPSSVAGLYSPVITRQAVSLWEVVPPKRVRKLAVKAQMQPHEIRPDLPDIFPPPEI